MDQNPTLTQWKSSIRHLIESLFLRIPLNFPRYKKRSSNFHTGSTGDEAYLRSETTRLFNYFALSKLDPNAVVVELRQMTTYRPDTYVLLYQFATLIQYLFHSDPNFLNNPMFGEAPIERLITAFLNHPVRFSPNGRQLLPPANKPQDSVERTCRASEECEHIASVICEVAAAAVVTHTPFVVSQNTQIRCQTAISSNDIVTEDQDWMLERCAKWQEGTI